MRIILIDDDFGVTENLGLYLNRSFHTVQALSWVEDAGSLRQILDDFQPEGVILDYGMTPIGTDIYRWIKEWRTVPIVFYTSYATSSEYLHDMTAAGARDDEIIEKREVGLDIPVLLRALGA